MIVVAVAMAMSEQFDALYAMIASVVETQKAHTAQNEVHQQRLVELTESQAQMNQSTHELREGQASLQAQVQQISSGMTTLHSKTADMEARFEALKLQFKCGEPAGVDEDSAMGTEKKRKCEAPSPQHAGAGSRVGSRGATPRVVYVGPGAGSSGDAPAGGGGGAGARRDGGDSSIKCRFVVKRMPMVMKSRLPSLLAGLYELMGDGLQRVQGGASGSAYTFVMSSPDLVDRVLLGTRRSPSWASSMTERWRWLSCQTGLGGFRSSSQWNGQLLRISRVSAGSKTHRWSNFVNVSIYVRRVGKEVMTKVGVGYYREVSESGLEPNVWFSFTPEAEFVVAAGGIRESMSLAKDV